MFTCIKKQNQKTSTHSAPGTTSYWDPDSNFIQAVIFQTRQWWYSSIVMINFRCKNYRYQNFLTNRLTDFSWLEVSQFIKYPISYRPTVYTSTAIHLNLNRYCVKVSQTTKNYMAENKANLMIVYNYKFFKI